MNNRFGGDFTSTNLDLVLAVVIALGLPFASVQLLTVTGGAATSLLLYYGVCSLLVVRWRKGTLDYHWPNPWPWKWFLLCLPVPLALAGTNWGTPLDSNTSMAGFLITLIGWSLLNGAVEHLSWFYVLDAWRNRWSTGALRWVGLTVGIVLLLVFVALIHALFWVQFLPATKPSPWEWAALPLNILLTGAYALLYYRSRSMWPVFVIHTLADIQLVALSYYSILPAL
jgi:hypothetical protein